MAISIALPSPGKTGTPPLPRSQADRLWLIGGAVVAFVLLLIGYFFFISPQRSHTGNVNSQVNAARAQNATLQQHIDTLRGQNANLDQYMAQLRAARLALPASNGVADFVRTLQSLGNATQTNVTTLSVGAGSPVSFPTASTNAANPAAAANNGGSAAQSNTAKPTANGASATDTGLLSYALSVQVTGSPGALNKFLDQLQTVQPRAVLITQLTESTGTLPGSPGAAAGQARAGTTLQLSMLAFATATR